jgi:hypothetical protein
MAEARDSPYGWIYCSLTNELAEIARSAREYVYPSLVAVVHGSVEVVARGW